MNRRWDVLLELLRIHYITMWLLWPEIEISSAMFYVECVSQFILDWSLRSGSWTGDTWLLPASGKNCASSQLHWWIRICWPTISRPRLWASSILTSIMWWKYSRDSEIVVVEIALVAFCLLKRLSTKPSSTNGWLWSSCQMDRLVKDFYISLNSKFMEHKFRNISSWYVDYSILSLCYG